jgi:hypothetical protein
MGLVALVIGTSVTAAATERVTIPLVLTSTLAWAFVPGIQLFTGLVLVRGAAPGARVHALERYFDTHRPWSLWILGVHALFLVVPASRGVALLLVPFCVVPAVLTIRALVTVCREVLGMGVAAARRAVAVHQSMTYLIVLVYAAWASAYLPRVLGLLR